MIRGADPTTQLAADGQSLDRLRLQAKQDPDRALRGAAQQFEAVFLHMMLKSMREATPQDGMFDSEQTRFFTGMFDQQLAQTLSQRGVGLADMMVRQLARARVDEARAAAGADLPAPAGGFPVPYRPTEVPAAPQAPGAGVASGAQAFVSRILPHAEAASRATGIPARFMVGHAALETGWGRKEIVAADGTPSHNLFGIKAGRGWTGPVVEAVTTEYVNGEPRRTVEKFRAYPSYTEAFQDYARLITATPRYAGIRGAGDASAFAVALQRAGYATDPQYADKLTRVLTGVTLRRTLTA